MKNEVMYHIGISKGDIKGATWAIIAGDPGRIPMIANMCDSSKKLKVSREYTSYLATLNNKHILVMSHGIGGPSTAIAIEELKKIGIEKIIRVGTCGGMDLDVLPGDLVIANSAIRQEGTTKEYMPVEFPAVSSFEITSLLKSTADELKFKNHVGIVQCKDSFYGQHNPETMPVSYELLNKWNAWLMGGCLASEMETATLFVLSSIYKIKAGAVLLSVWNQERANKGLKDKDNFDTKKAIRVAIESIRKDLTK